MKRRKFMPYVRRVKRSDKAGSMRVAFQMAFREEQVGLTFYVMVQHGFDEVMAVGSSKREVQQSPVMVACGSMTFRRWARVIRKRAAGKRKDLR